MLAMKNVSYSPTNEIRGTWNHQLQENFKSGVRLIQISDAVAMQQDNEPICLQRSCHQQNNYEAVLQRLSALLFKSGDSISQNSSLLTQSTSGMVVPQIGFRQNVSVTQHLTSTTHYAVKSEG